MIGKRHRLHHLPDQPITHDHDRITVFFRQREGRHHHFDRLLNAGRGHHQQPVIAVPAPFGGLEIIRLGWQNAAQTGTAANDVDKNGRHLGAGNIADRLAHQTDTGT